MIDPWSRTKPRVFRHDGAWVIANWHRRDSRTGMRVWLTLASAPTIRELTRKIQPGFWAGILWRPGRYDFRREYRMAHAARYGGAPHRAS